MKPCPFCGSEKDEDEKDTVYPSGIYWRIVDGLIYYISHKDRLPTDNRCWNVVCDCGVRVTGDSREECLNIWNKRYEGTSTKTA